ncbi:oligosaccharyl transferase subunit ost3/OST6, partial [Nowakowskiella sp. JEL0078]
MTSNKFDTWLLEFMEMKLLLLVLANLLIVSIQCASADSSKVKRLSAAVSASGGPFKKTIFNSELFDLVYDKPRNFSTFMIFTALDTKHKCKPCVEFSGEVSLITAAWGRVYQPGKLYIAELDYNEKTAVAFQTLQLSNVPLIAYFPPTEGPLAKPGKTAKDYETYDAQNKGLKAEDFAEFFEKQSGVKLVIRRPINWLLYGLLTLFVVFIILIAQLFGEALWSVFSQKGAWMAVSIGATIFFCAGHMWNQIRNPEFAGINQNHMQFFAGDAAIAVSFVALASKIPEIKNSTIQTTAFWGAFISFVVLYSILLRIFTVKN